MGGTAVCVNIGSVRLVVDHIGLRLKCLEYALCNGRRASVCTVKTNLYVLEVTAWNGDQVSDIAVTSGSKVDGASDVFLAGKRKLLNLAVNISLDTLLNLSLDLLSVSVQKLDSVIIEWVMACGDHNTAVKILCTNCKGYTWCGGYMKKINICTGSGKTCNQSVLKHVAASSGVLADYDLGLMVTSVIPSHITSYLECIVNSQLNICLSSKSVCSKIFSHNYLSSYGINKVRLDKLQLL